MSKILTDKWDRRFMDLAKHVSTWSKDPFTQVGAVLVSPDRSQVFLGYNGFPRGMADWESRYADRPTKNLIVVHAEANAIAQANTTLHGFTLYCTLACCTTCAGLVIQKGIKRVVVPSIGTHESRRLEQALAMDMFAETGVQYDAEIVQLW